MSESTIQVVRAAPLIMMPRFRTDPLGSLAQLHKDHGDFIATLIIPGLMDYLIFTPELAHVILVERAAEFKKPALAKRMLAGAFGNGLFFSEGEFWHRQRKLAQPAFHHARLHSYADHMVDHTQTMLDRWQADSQPIDLVKATRALTLTIVVDALFMTDIAGLTDSIGAAMGELGHALAAQTVNIVDTLMPGWIPTPVNRHKKHALDILNPIIRQLIADRRVSHTDGGDLLSMFINAVDEETGESMTDQQIRDELMTMFIAGHETSAVALSWALIELMRNPAITMKLRAELDRVVQSRPVTLDDLPNLPYLRNIVQESLRLYPPVIFVSRQAIQPLKLGTSLMPTSGLINIMIYNIQRDPRWYMDPDRFNPDRWTPDMEKSLPKCAYMPFGAGPRICIGNGFARLEMQFVLATIIQHVDLAAITPQAAIEPTFGVTLGFKKPVFVRAAPANTAIIA